MTNILSGVSWLRKDSQLVEFVKAGAVTFILKVLAGVVGFLISLVVARTMSTSEAGLFFLALSLVAAFSTIGRLGLDQPITKLVASSLVNGDWTSIGKIYRLVMVATLISGLLLSVVLFSMSGYLSKNIFNKPDLEPVLSVMSWAVIAVVIFWIHSSFFQGIKNMYFLQVFQNLGVGFLFLIIILLIRSVIPISSAEISGFVYVLSSVLIAVCAFLFWRNSYRGESSSFVDFILCKRIAHSALPLFIVAIFEVIMTWMGQIFVGAWRTSEEIAIFSVTVRVANLVALVLMATNSIAFPKFSALFHSGNIKEIKRVAIWSSRFMTIGCLPLFGVLVFFPDIILQFFGDEFVAGESALIILAVGQFVNIVTGSVGGLLSMTGQGRCLLVSTIAAVLVMLLLCVTLVPAYGVVGAAAAQSCALSLQMLLNSWYVKKTLGFLPMNIFTKV